MPTLATIGTIVSPFLLSGPLSETLQAISRIGSRATAVSEVVPFTSTSTRMNIDLSRLSKRTSTAKKSGPQSSSSN